jgi:MFS family permease
MTALVGQEEGLEEPVRSWRATALVPTLVGVAAIVAIMNSLGAPLIPTIAGSDHVSLSTGQWLLTAALLTGALATPVMGRLADGPKQRQVIFVALSVVLVGCVVAAVSDRFIVVVAGRALQGVGLGLVPVTMAMARSHLPKAKAGRAIATLSITTAVGAGLGYPLTGIVAEAFGVHAAFWFAGLLVAGALAVAIVVLPASRPVAARRFDVVGAGALSLVVIGISVALSEGGEWGWTSTRTLVTAVVSLIILAVWIPHELRHDDPLIDLRQVRNRSVLTADVSGFMICVAMYLFTPIVVEFVQIPVDHGYGFGASVVVSGLVFLPLSVGTVVASRCLPFYERRFGTRSMIPLGSVIFAISTIFFALEHRALWEAFVAVGFAGFGVGFTFAAMPGFIVRAVPPGETGSATGFYQVLRSIGLSLGSALAAAVLTAYTLQGHTFPTAEGFRVALIAASGLCLATAVISYLLPGRAGDRPTMLTEQERRAADLLMEEEAELAGTGTMLAEGHPMEEQEHTPT